MSKLNSKRIAGINRKFSRIFHKLILPTSPRVHNVWIRARNSTSTWYPFAVGASLGKLWIPCLLLSTDCLPTDFLWNLSVVRTLRYQNPTNSFLKNFLFFFNEACSLDYSGSYRCDWPVKRFAKRRLFDSFFRASGFILWSLTCPHGPLGVVSNCYISDEQLPGLQLW